MIGNWFLTLTPEQEDRVLRTKMGRFGIRAPCLVMATEPRHSIGSACCVSVLCVGDGSFRWESHGRRTRHAMSIAGQYDTLCFRFGDARINAAIRTRVLRNRLRRTLTAPQLESVTV